MLALSTLLFTIRPADASHSIVIGVQCDIRGPARAEGGPRCAGHRDYVELVNSKGGIGGHALKAVEVDHESKVPIALDSYERFKKEGAVLVSLYGSRETHALASKLGDDRIPGTSVGFSPAAAADGRRYPYLFPLAATSWSQAAGAVKYIGTQLPALKNTKIAYVFDDDPSGREAIPLLEAIGRREGFDLRAIPVAPGALSTSIDAVNEVKRYGAAFTITRLSGPMPAAFTRTANRDAKGDVRPPDKPDELKGNRLEPSRVVSLAWGASETDVETPGATVVKDGYNVIEVAGVGADYPVLDEIREMYRKQGKATPREMESTAYYNRGVMISAMHVEAIRHAIAKKPDGQITGDDVKAGLEKIKGLTLGGLLPALEISRDDHEGGGWVQVWQVKNGRLARATEWYTAYRGVVSRLVKDTGRKP